MTDLRERMHDTVDHRHTDLAGLAAVARRQGSALRHRRRLATAGSALAVGAAASAVAGVAGAGWLAGQGQDQRAPGAVQGDPTPAAGKSRQTSVPDTTRTTGRTTAAALYAAVTEQVSGTGSDFVGQGPMVGLVGDQDTYGELAFAPADGSGAGRIGVNVQSAAILRSPGRTAREGFVCADWMETCEVTTLADGSMLRTYSERSAAAGGGTGERLVAEHLTDQLRVVASAENGFEGPSNEWDITRPHAVLTTDQLTAVVLQPWWGFELPAEFAGARDVPSYTDLGGSIDAQPIE